MSKIKNLFLVFVIIIFINGCAMYENRINSWVGSNIQELVDSKWGFADKTFTAPNGNTVYEYVSTYNYSTPATTTKTGGLYGSPEVYTTTGGTQGSLVCTTWFEVDEDDYIVSARYKGIC